MKTDAFIGLGSNLKNPVLQLARSVAELAALPNTMLVAQSPFYSSQPVGPQDQPDFVNGVVWLSTSLTAHELLNYLQYIEKNHGRERHRHWGPRTLDLDLLIFGNQTISDERLIVPHRELPNRDFVLQPLVDLNPYLTLPDGSSVVALRKLCPDNHLRKLHPVTQSPSAPF
jgi:2-amino-4-hydroxy-6-hydroxymethyldihydropteridine diphosphokinase